MMHRETVIQTERAMLADLLLVHPSDVPAVAEMLRSDQLTDQRHRAIFEAAVGLAAVGRDVDILAVQYALEASGQLGAVGHDYVLNLSASGAMSAKRAARTLAAAARIRALQGELYTLTADLDAVDPQQADEAIGRVVSRVMDYAANAEDGGRVGMGQAVRLFLADATDNWHRRAENRPVRSGHSCTFRAVNDPMVGGFRPGEAYAIGARPKTGKTAFALSIACGMATRARGHVLYLSWEDQPLWLGGRFASAMLKSHGMSLHSGDFDADTLAEALELRDQAARKGGGLDDLLTIVHRPGAGVELVDSEVVRYQRSRAARDFPLVGVVVDHIGRLIHDAARHGGDAELRRVVKACETVAKRRHVPIIMTSQLRRLQGGTGKARAPTVEDFRGSDALLECCSALMLLHRPRAVDPDYQRGEEAHLVVPANRLGKVGRWPLHFNERTGVYTDAEEPWGDLPGTGSPWGRR